MVSIASLASIGPDIRLAFRALIRSPGYSATAIATLALGIGANALALTFANAVFLRPLPFVRGSELVGISATHRAANGDVLDFAPAGIDFLAYATRAHTLSGVGAINSQTFALQGPEHPETILGATLSASMWTVLGVNAVAGRVFTESEDRTDATIVVMSAALQQRLFPGDPGNAIGRELIVDGHAKAVIGVMPEGYRPRMNPGDIWMPLGVTEANATTSRQLQLVGRLSPGANLETARADMRQIASQLAQERPTTHRDWGVSVKDLKAKVGDSARAVTMTLIAAVAVLLLLTCANVTNLAMARAAKRSSEVSTRLALGASKSSVFRHHLLEAIVISLAGSALGVLLAAGGLRLTIGMLTTDNPLVTSVQMDWRTLLLVLVLSLLIGTLCSVIPTLYSLRVADRTALAGGGRTAYVGRKERSLRRALMTFQVGLAAVLLVLAFGALSTLRALGSAEVGFQPTNLHVASMTLPVSRYGDVTKRSGFVSQALLTLRSTAGIEAASVVSNRFVRGQSFQSMLTVDGIASEEPFPAEVRRIESEYFATVGLPLLQGRAFAPTDHATNLPVAIVNQSFVKTYLGGRDPIQLRVRRGANPWQTIVGVVPDVMDAGVGVAVGPALYLPFSQGGSAAASFVIRSRLRPSEVERALRRAVASVDPMQPVDRVVTMTQLLEESLGESRFKTLVLSVLAALALVIASLGIYGVTAYIVTEQRREVALRIAIGAETQSIVRHFSLDAGRWVAIGVLSGLAVAVILSRAAGEYVPELVEAGVGTYIAIGCLLFCVGTIAPLLPVIRVARQQAAPVLRGE